MAVQTNTGNSASASATLPTHTQGQLLVCALKSASTAPASDDGATWTQVTTAKNDAKSIAVYTKTAGASESAPTFTVTSGAWTTIVENFDASGVRTSGRDQSGFSQTGAQVALTVTVGDIIIVTAFAQNQASYDVSASNPTVTNTVQATDTTAWGSGIADATSETLEVDWTGFTFDNLIGLALIPSAAAAGAYLSPMRGIV